MRQVLALCTALVFTLSLAGAALAQGTGSSGTSAPSSGSSATSPSGSGSTGSPPDTTKSTAPSGSDTKSTTGAPKSAAGKMAGGARGTHKMMGEVTKIDEAKGTVSLKTDEGDMDLHFPPSALKGIKEGDRVEVQLAIRPAGSAASSKTPAKSPSSTSGTAKPKTTP